MGQKQRRKAAKRGDGVSISLEVAGVNLRGANRWPVVRSVMSGMTSFQLCGQATVCVARESPGGQLVALVGLINLRTMGFDELTITPFRDAVELQSFLDVADQDLGRRLRELPADQVSRILWGTYGFMEECGLEYEPEPLARFSALVPFPPARPDDWLRWLTGPSGLVDPQLLIHSYDPARLQVPAGKEPVLHTSAVFRIHSEGQLRHLIESNPDSFLPGESIEGTPSFKWVVERRRKMDDPKSPLVRAFGTVALADNFVFFTAPVPSWAGRFAEWLEEHLSGQVELIRAEWTDVKKDAWRSNGA